MNSEGMILSVSRRTDIPNYYSDWFYNRINEGFLYVRNPMNANQVSKISLSPEEIFCIIFWTKNPKNMMDRLDELDKYKYYFQFTLNAYGKEVEPEMPELDERIKTFQELSDKIGKEKVIWRYDPILFSKNYDYDFHKEKFKYIAENLKGYTDRVVISFIDLYGKTKRNTKDLNLDKISDEENELRELAKEMKKIATDNNLEIESCAERIDLDDIGIKHGACIDKKLIESTIGFNIKGKEDNQRSECKCLKCEDVGIYNTCLNLCKYCYANFNDKIVKEKNKLYNVDSPFLCDDNRPNYKVSERKPTIKRDTQSTLF